MNHNFIVKLETKNYYIGSFDAYIDLSKELMRENSNLSSDKVDDVLKSMPTTYRAAITDKKEQYIGYIGLYNVDAKNSISSIRFEVDKALKEEHKEEILEEFNKYLVESLNITEIDELIYKTRGRTQISKKEIDSKKEIALPSKLLIPGVSNETLEKFSQDYSIPKLQMPFTIKSDSRVIGIVGLTNLIWSNKRANLNIFLDKKLGNEISNMLAGYIIDDYINYVHDSNVHNITMSVKGSDYNILRLLNDTKMNYYGQIPFSAVKGDYIESNLMFQHLPNMKKNNGIIIPHNRSVSLSLLSVPKKELANQIELMNGFKLVSPKVLADLNIDIEQILEGHIKALQNRNQFAIPLGEDKYILQKGNGKYGISKAIMNYNYIILDEKNHYAGYINILRQNANGKNAEIEVGINPNIQHKGLGTIVVNRFYEELFSVGYASVTSAVFEFNHPSLKLHDKIAEFNGVRLEAYYINGRFWNMNFYTKTNNIINESLSKIKVKTTKR